MKLDLAVVYGTICGGCDVAVVDSGEKILDLVAATNIIYWPAVVDSKEEDLEKAQKIDVGIFFGGIRTDKHKKMAQLLREKSEVFVAFGSCACLGGIPGLGNASYRNDLLEQGYVNTLTTENPLLNIPGETQIGDDITLPKLEDYVSPVTNMVKTDVCVPGCPPPVESVVKLIEIVERLSNGETITSKLTIAEDTALCEFCPRNKPDKIVLDEFKRIHEGPLDDEECFLKQGIICLGPVTRGGCGETCIKANMPCRGCFGPIPDIDDQGTSFLASVATSLKAGKEKEVGEEKIKRLINSIPDPVGFFYRFSLAASGVNKKAHDLEEER